MIVHNGMSAIYSSDVWRKSFRTALGGLRSWFTQTFGSQAGFSFSLFTCSRRFRFNSFHATGGSIMIAFAGARMNSQQYLLVARGFKFSFAAPAWRIFFGNRSGTTSHRFSCTGNASRNLSAVLVLFYPSHCEPEARVVYYPMEAAFFAMACSYCCRRMGKLLHRFLCLFGFAIGGYTVERLKFRTRVFQNGCAWREPANKSGKKVHPALM